MRKAKIVTVDNKNYKVIKQEQDKGCSGCAGKSDYNLCHTLPPCYDYKRKCPIIFIEVKEPL